MNPEPGYELSEIDINLFFVIVIVFDSEYGRNYDLVVLLT